MVPRNLIWLFLWSFCLFNLLEGRRNRAPYTADGSGGTEQDSLVLVHVLFRHGNRTPNGPEELYPKDPYLNEQYRHIGLGQLTNAGKTKEYGIGKALRDKYDAFLGPNYDVEAIDPRTTDYNRTKASLELVLASLFRPQGKQIWNSVLPWQPVPYNYWRTSEDKVLMGVQCPKYLRLYNETIKTPKWQAEFRKYQDTFDYISENSGLNVQTFQSVYNLYFGLSTEEEYGFKLPAWTRKVWPKTVTDLAIKEYFVATATTDLIRMASGYLLEKIIRDSVAKIYKRTPERKMYVYSAHENNVAELLIALGVFDKPHIPNYGSYILLELHKINNVYGFKIFYQNYESNKPRPLTLPACTSFCDIDTFIALTEEYIPTRNLCYES